MCIDVTLICAHLTEAGWVHKDKVNSLNYLYFKVHTELELGAPSTLSILTSQGLSTRLQPCAETLG